MKGLVLALPLLLFIAPTSLARDHLSPGTNILAGSDGYELKIRHVFGDIFNKGVILRAIVIPSFADEYAVGIKATGEGAEAFVLEPSSRIWATQLLQDYEQGKIKSFDLNGKLVPLEDDKTYQELKRTTPADYREIKAVRRAHPLPKEVAEKIKTLWDQMLLGVRHPETPIAGADGVLYYFSARLQTRGELSGHVWSPEPDSKTGRFTALADSLGDYARGKVDLKSLNEKIEKATSE